MYYLAKGFHPDNDGFDEIILNNKVVKGEWKQGFVFKTNEHTYIGYANQYDDDLFYSPANIFSEVIPETICAWTGLYDNTKWEELSDSERFSSENYNKEKDWKGRKIFENDVITVSYFECGNLYNEETTVTYKNGSWSPFNWVYSCDGCDCSLSIKSVKIIGNIFR